MNWTDALEFHAAAAENVAAAAARVPAEKWGVPAAEGKWSPAEVVEHLCLTYETLEKELRGGDGMRILLPAWKRLILRWTIFPRLLRGEPFPKGVRAPREARPASVPASQVAGIARFRERAASFAGLAEETRKARPAATLTHPYFGKGKLQHAVVFCARHLHHHQRQLPE